MRKYFIGIISLLLIFNISLPGQTINRTGTSAGQFLKFGVSARENALGEAGVAIAENPAALYWNPAGIPRIKFPSFIGSQNQLYLDLSYSFLGFVYPVNSSNAVGVSALFLNSGEMEVTTLDQPQGTGRYFSWESMMLAISYGRYFTDHLSLGITLKYVREGAYSLTANGVAIDVGSLLDTGVLGMKLGVSLSNLGTEMHLGGKNLQIDHDWYKSENETISSSAFLETSAWRLPLLFRLGLAMEIIGGQGQLAQSENHKIIIATDTVDPRDGLLQANIGVEYQWRGMFMLRAGYRGISLEQNDSYVTSSYSAGLGFRYRIDKIDLSLDYGFCDYKMLGSGHQVSVVIGIP
ncbi:MAG: PorV/PorQ family protein [Calditrichaeota bacterium]|nr:PorV/PorQ family protein [Calditrichota bacterium]